MNALFLWTGPETVMALGHSDVVGNDHQPVFNFLTFQRTACNSGSGLWGGVPFGTQTTELGLVP